jgi:hypothetical protein
MQSSLTIIVSTIEINHHFGNWNQSSFRQSKQILVLTIEINHGFEHWNRLWFRPSNRILMSKSWQFASGSEMDRDNWRSLTKGQSRNRHWTSCFLWTSRLKFARPSVPMSERTFRIPIGSSIHSHALDIKQLEDWDLLKLTWALWIFTEIFLKHWRCFYLLPKTIVFAVDLDLRSEISPGKIKVRK